MSSKKPKTQTVDTSPWAPSRKYIKDLFPQGVEAQKEMQSADINSLDLTADFSDAQKQGQNFSLQTAQNLAGQTGQQVDALSRGLNADNIENNPYFQQSVQAAINPVVNNFNRKILPQIQMNAIGGAGLGSSRQGIAEGLAMSDLNQQILDTTARMSNAAYTQGQDTSLRALGLAPTVANQQLLPGNIMQQVGGIQQAQEQAQLDEIAKKWDFSRTQDFDALERMAGLLRGWNGGTTTQPAAQGANPMGALLGGVAGFAVGGPAGAGVGAGIGGMF